MREQIFEAFGAAVKAFATGHAVFGVRAFVAFVAGENIQVCTVELDAMRGNLGEIAAYVVRCELGAQVGLVAARPACVFGHRTVCQPNRIVGIKGLCGEVVIAVLVMRAENIALLMAGATSCLPSRPLPGRPADSRGAHCRIRAAPNHPSACTVGLHPCRAVCASASRAAQR